MRRIRRQVGEFPSVVRWSRSPVAIGIVVAVVLFAYFYGFGPVWPTNVEDWVAGDWGTHMLGWLHFRHEPWLRFPLGQVESFGYPTGTSLIYTDSIPLIALVLRPFSAVLPRDFQYLGLFIFASYVLQGAYGARIVARIVDSRVAIASGAALFVLTPAFLNRNVHPALTAHWLILAVIAASLGPTRSTRWRLVVLVGLTVTIQPYLWMYLMVLLGGLLLDDVRRGGATWSQVAKSFAGCTLGSFVLMSTIGTFASGFQPTWKGFYGEVGSANVLSLLAPAGMSRVLKDIAFPSLQDEGVAFLGLGVLLLLLYGVVGVALTARIDSSTLRAIPLRSSAPLITIASSCLLALYAFTDHIYVGTHDVRVPWLFRPIRPFVDTFRTSGRGIWPLMYFVVCGTVWLAARATQQLARRPRVFLAAALACSAAVQFVDLRIPSRHASVVGFFLGSGSPVHTKSLDDPRWKLLRRPAYSHLAVIPTTQYGCSMPDGFFQYQRAPIALLGLEAYRHHLSFNGGFFARVRTDVGPTCERKDARDELVADTVYVFTRDSRPPGNAACDLLDLFTVCVRRSNTDGFARSLG